MRRSSKRWCWLDHRDPTEPAPRRSSRDSCRDRPTPEGHGTEDSMALYAFDGTWNTPDAVDDAVDRSTNVYKFLSFYAPQDASARSGLESYKAGVGTRFGKPGHIVGGFFGAGGRDRIAEMVEAFRENWRSNE